MRINGFRPAKLVYWKFTMAVHPNNGQIIQQKTEPTRMVNQWCHCRNVGICDLELGIIFHRTIESFVELNWIATPSDGNNVFCQQHLIWCEWTHCISKCELMWTILRCFRHMMRQPEPRLQHSVFWWTNHGESSQMILRLHKSNEMMIGSFMDPMDGFSMNPNVLIAGLQASLLQRKCISMLCTHMSKTSVYVEVEIITFEILRTSDFGGRKPSDSASNTAIPK